MSKQEIDQCTRIIEDPHSSDSFKAKAYNDRGKAYSEQEEYDLAVADFTEAIDLYTDDGDKAVNEEIENIKKYLKNIKKEDKQTPSVYNKTLELLSGVHYLIKDATYAYEKEYRLICFANERNIPDIVQREDPEDTQEQHPPRIYVETDILPKLCGVLTAPKLSKAQVLDIQYSLHRYTQENKLSYLKEQPIHTSTIPYR